MTVVLIGTLVGLVLARLVWALRCPDRLYHFPTLCAFVYAGFIVPESISLFGRSRDLPTCSFERVLVVACLSLIGVLFGDSLASKRLKYNAIPYQYDYRTLLRFAIIAAAIGLAALWSLYGSGVDTRNQAWTGAAVVYNYFGKLFFYATALTVLVSLRIKNRVALCLAGAFCSVALARVVIFYRRAELLELLITIAFAAYFVRHFTVPRLAVIAFVAIMPLVIASAHEYRYAVQTSQGIDLGATRKVDFVANFRRKMLGGKKSEMENAVFYTSAVARSGQYSLGVHYWNDFVQATVPKSLFGADFKQSLFLPLVHPSILAGRYYNYIPKSGVMGTGFSDSFWAFGYFGCVIFIGIGALARIVYTRALRGDIAFQFYFLILSVDALHTFPHSTSFFMFQTVHVIVWTAPVFLVARKRCRYEMAQLQYVHGASRRTAASGARRLPFKHGAEYR